MRQAILQHLLKTWRVSYCTLYILCCTSMLREETLGRYVCHVSMVRFSAEHPAWGISDKIKSGTTRQGFYFLFVITAYADRHTVSRFITYSLSAFLKLTVTHTNVVSQKDSKLTNFMQREIEISWNGSSSQRSRRIFSLYFQKKWEYPILDDY
jgi:hypothetical protein